MEDISLEMPHARGKSLRQLYVLNVYKLMDFFTLISLHLKRKSSNV
jgi:hypothetical protein